MMKEAQAALTPVLLGRTTTQTARARLNRRGRNQGALDGGGGGRWQQQGPFRLHSVARRRSWLMPPTMT